MDREQYLRELEARLSNRMAPPQLASVMRYYEEYFDEMGPDQEAKAIDDLGSPTDLSRRIMGDQVVRDLEHRVPPDDDFPPYKPPRRGLGAVWTVILAILAAPIAIPLAVGLVALAVGIFIAILALFLGLGIGGVACVAFGIFVAVVGFSSILVHGVATTMYFVGGGMLSAGVGVLLIAAAVAITGLCLGGLARLLGRMLRRRESNV